MRWSRGTRSAFSDAKISAVLCVMCCVCVCVCCFGDLGVLGVWGFGLLGCRVGVWGQGRW
jgi:hypothetical protein